jgi:hypothetical protein
MNKKDKYIENILTKNKLLNENKELKDKNKKINTNIDLESTFFSDDLFIDLDKDNTNNINVSKSSFSNNIEVNDISIDNEYENIGVGDFRENETFGVGEHSGSEIFAPEFSPFKLKCKINRNTKKNNISLMKTTLNYKLSSDELEIRREKTLQKNREIISSNYNKPYYISESYDSLKEKNKEKIEEKLLHKSLPNYLEKDKKIMDIILCDHNIDDDEISHRLLILEDKLENIEMKNEKIIEQNNEILILLNNINDTIKEQGDIYLTSSFYSFSDKKN